MEKLCVLRITIIFMFCLQVFQLHGWHIRAKYRTGSAIPENSEVFCWVWQKAGGYPTLTTLTQRVPEFIGTRDFYRKISSATRNNLWMDGKTNWLLGNFSSWIFFCLHSGGYFWPGKTVASITFSYTCYTTAQCFWRSNSHFRYRSGCKIWCWNFSGTRLCSKLLWTNFPFGIARNFSKSQVTGWEWLWKHAFNERIAASANCHFWLNLSRLDCTNQS